MEELKDKLSDRESELAAAQRKLVMARASATAADADATTLPVASIAGASRHAARGSSAFGRSGGSFNGTQHGLTAAAAAAAASPVETDMQREIEGLHKTLAARVR